MNPGLIALLLTFGAIFVYGLVAEWKKLHPDDMEARRRAALTSLPPLSASWLGPKNVIPKERDE